MRHAENDMRLRDVDDRANVTPSRCPAWYILEATGGAVYLVPAEALIGYQVPAEDAALLSALVSGADLISDEVEVVAQLLLKDAAPGGPPPAVVATRQVRAWTLLD
jgi:hypothetical protein